MVKLYIKIINYVEFVNFLFKPVENKIKKIFIKKEEEEYFKLISNSLNY